MLDIDQSVACLAALICIGPVPISAGPGQSPSGSYCSASFATHCCVRRFSACWRCGSLVAIEILVQLLGDDGSGLPRGRIGSTLSIRAFLDPVLPAEFTVVDFSRQCYCLLSVLMVMCPIKRPPG